jgi:hypothetical protein
MPDSVVLMPPDADDKRPDVTVSPCGGDACPATRLAAEAEGAMQGDGQQSHVEDSGIVTAYIMRAPARFCIVGALALLLAAALIVPVMMLEERVDDGRLSPGECVIGLLLTLAIYAAALAGILIAIIGEPPTAPLQQHAPAATLRPTSGAPCCTPACLARQESLVRDAHRWLADRYAAELRRLLLCKNRQSRNALLLFLAGFLCAIASLLFGCVKLAMQAAALEDHAFVSDAKTVGLVLVAASPLPGAIYALAVTRVYQLVRRLRRPLDAQIADVAEQFASAQFGRAPNVCGGCGRGTARASACACGDGRGREDRGGRRQRQDDSSESGSEDTAETSGDGDGVR